jgi:hypothetical protein
MATEVGDGDLVVWALATSRGGTGRAGEQLPMLATRGRRREGLADGPGGYGQFLAELAVFQELGHERTRPLDLGTSGRRRCGRGVMLWAFFVGRSTRSGSRDALFSP